jgi:hypothetical protein
LIVRDLEDEPQGLTVLRVLGDPRGSLTRPKRLFEAAISMAATAIHHLYRQARPSALCLPSGERLVVLPGDRGSLLEADRALANLEAAPLQDSYPELDDLGKISIFWLDSGCPGVMNVPRGVTVLSAEPLLASNDFRMATFSRPT